MRQNLYTCCRCGLEQRTQIECDDAPIGWALIGFQRDYMETVGGEQQSKRTILSTHACGDCSAEVLRFLESELARSVEDRDLELARSPKVEIDGAFDHGGVA